MPQEDYQALYPETEGENQDGAAQNTDQTGDQAATDQTGEAQQDQKMVPLEVVQSLREENKEWKDRARKLEDYIHNSAPQQNSQQAQQQQSNDPFGDVEDDDFLTVGQARQLIQQQEQQSKQVLREMKLRQTLPDYDDVIQNQLPELIKEKPYLRDAIMSSGDPYSLAYELGSAYKERKGGKQQTQSSQQQQQQSEQSSELEKTLEKSQQKPGSTSQAASASQGSLGDADVYNGMSPGDLDDEIRKVKRGG